MAMRISEMACRSVEAMEKNSRPSVLKARRRVVVPARRHLRARPRSRTPRRTRTRRTSTTTCTASSDGGPAPGSFPPIFFALEKCDFSCWSITSPQVGRDASGVDVRRPS
jgi:hypothetical protein